MTYTNIEFLGYLCWDLRWVGATHSLGTGCSTSARQGSPRFPWRTEGVLTGSGGLLRHWGYGDSSGESSCRHLRLCCQTEAQAASVSHRGVSTSSLPGLSGPLLPPCPAFYTAAGLTFEKENSHHVTLLWKIVQWLPIAFRTTDGETSVVRLLPLWVAPHPPSVHCSLTGLLCVLTWVPVKSSPLPVL